MTEQLASIYKFTGPDRTTYNGYQWPEIGEWAEVGKGTAKLTASALCTSRVFHVTDAAHLLTWTKEELYEVEVDEARGIIRGPDKIGVRRARLTRRVDTWNERTARLFAADCAEHVLPLFEKERPTDMRVRDCIAVVRRFAAEDAAWAAAGAAAEDAAWAAAGAAAGAAAEDAAGAETQWQQARLMDYLEGVIA